MLASPRRASWSRSTPGGKAPSPLQLDVIHSRLELTIPITGGEAIAANPFQRDFWNAALTYPWLSVSASTSAGKSYVVKRWFEERIADAEQFRGVYFGLKPGP